MGAIPISTELTNIDHRDHLKARLGIKRMEHIVTPGLYSIGSPRADSPVFVSANYTLSFDALRSNLKGIDGYILVLDTKGINVWCAAGKGSFGSEEIVNRVKEFHLSDVVTHRKLILPQLAAPGVCAHEVRKRSGFHVTYGPVRAEDIPEYLKLGEATAEMRRVRFPLKDRAALVPVEMRNNLPWMLIAALFVFLVAQWDGAIAVLLTYLAGTVLFPLLLPHIPTKEFSSKGLILGIIVALVFAASWSWLTPDLSGARTILGMVALVLLMAPWVSYLGLNFTGCSTYTSRTGVRREIFRYIPVMAVMLVTGTILAIIYALSGPWGW